METLETFILQTVAVSVSSIRPRLQSGRQPPRHQIIPAPRPPAAIIRTTGVRGREAGYQGPSRGRGGGNELLILILCELGRQPRSEWTICLEEGFPLYSLRRWIKGIPRRQSSAVVFSYLLILVILLAVMLANIECKYLFNHKRI